MKAQSSFFDTQRKEDEVKKSTVIILTAFMVVFTAFAKDVKISSSADAAGGLTATQTVKSVRFIQNKDGSDWTNLDTMNVLVPANCTGTVSVASYDFSEYQVIATSYCTNTTSSSVLNTQDLSGIPVASNLRVIITAVGGSTNSWPYILYFNGGHD